MVVFGVGRGLLAGEFFDAVVGEILWLALFDGLGDEIGDEFGFVAGGVVGGGSAGFGVAHAGVAEVGGGDEGVDFGDDDVVFFEFGAGGEGEAEEGAFGGGVDAVLGDGHEGGAGVDVDDGAGALGAHERDDGLHGDDGAEDVEVEDFVEEVRFDFFDGGGVGAAGVVDEGVDAAVVVVDGGDGFFEGGEVGHVAGDGEAVWEGGGEGVENVFGAGEEGDFGTFFGEEFGGGEADAGGGAGDEDYFVLDIHGEATPNEGGETTESQRHRGRHRGRLGNCSFEILREFFLRAGNVTALRARLVNGPVTRKMLFLI